MRPREPQGEAGAVKALGQFGPVESFRDFFEDSPLAVFRTGLDGRFLALNEACAAVLGYASVAQLLAEVKNVGELYADPGERGRILARVLESAGPIEVEMRLRRRGGGARWLRGASGVVRDAAGRPVALQGALIDITEAKAVRAQAELERRLADDELRRFRHALDHSADLIVLVDRETMRFVDVNETVCRLTGYSREELIGAQPDTILPVTVQTLAAAYDALIAEPGKVDGMRSYYICKDGSRLPFESNRHVMRSGGRWLIAAISRDTRERDAAEAALRRRETELRTLVENSPDGISRFDREMRFAFVNPAVAKSLGCAAEALLGRRLGEAGFPEALCESLEAAMRRAFDSGEPQALEYALDSPRGRREYQARFAPERDAGGKVGSLLVISHDITERKRYEARIAHLANHDALTGLPNRALLRDRVEQAIAHARRSHGCLGLLFVDLDRFKLVNDSWGHGAGDSLLLEAGARLQAAVRDGDTVARLGGDEFVVLLSDLARPGDAALVARKVAARLAQPMAAGGRELHVSASMGISLFPGDGEDFDTLLKAADAAMYRAKDGGRNTYFYYSAELGEQARARVETETGLRLALEREELRLHYQPEVALATGEILAFEALLRWQHPERGLVAPGQFIPVAEESGLIVSIGAWAMREACRQAAQWAAAGLGPVKVAVNLSAREFWQGSVADVVRGALEGSGLAPGQLEVEITESVVARDLDQVMRSLAQLRRMGVSVAIDDFGTGYSSLAYLRALPIRKLKIDRSFIHGIPGDRDAAALVGEIIRLAHVLALQVVAEGVETEAQAAFLREAGCEGMQGFLLARPMPAGQCEAMLSRSPARKT